MSHFVQFYACGLHVESQCRCPHPAKPTRVSEQRCPWTTCPTPEGHSREDGATPRSTSGEVVLMRERLVSGLWGALIGAGLVLGTWLLVVGISVLMDWLSPAGFLTAMVVTFSFAAGYDYKRWEQGREPLISRSVSE